MFEAGRLEKLEAALPELDRHFAAVHRGSEAPGMAFALVVDDATLFSRGYGKTSLDGGRPVTAETVFRVGSVTKPLTALGVLVLVGRGVVELDAPAANYLPELSGVVYPSKDSAALTLRHLLTHTSGLPSSVALPATPSERDILSALSGLRLQGEPGALPPTYSNFAYAVVGALIARVAQTPYEAFMNREVLKPLGMGASFWSQSAVPPQALASAYRFDGEDRPTLVTEHWRLGALGPSGGLYSNLNDLARWTRFELAAHASARAGQTTRANPAVPSSLVRAAHRPSAFFDTRIVDRGNGGNSDLGNIDKGVFASSSALGWWVHRDCDFDDIVIKDGAMMGYSASVLMLPERGVALIGLTNSRRSLNDALKQAARLLLSSGGLSPRRPRPSPKLDERARAVTALFTEFSRGRFDELFNQEFRDQVTEADFREWMSWQQSTLGSCRFEGFSDVRSPSDASWIARCDQGLRKYSMRLTSDERFDQVSSVAILTPKESLLSTVRKALAGEACPPSEPVCEAVLSGVRARQLTLPCNVGPLIDGNGRDVSAFELTCGQQALRLWLRTEADRLKSATINDVHAATRCVK